MIRRIELINFMSHDHTVIEPADGLTVLVGPHNCGKSAVVLALQILCYNDNSTFVTRHGERECIVKVETDDGHVIEWCRKNGSPRYTIDGQPFDRLNRSGQPDELHKSLRMPRVVFEGCQDFDVHFGEQKSPVFLLDKPPSHAAQFFASSSDANKLVQMQARHRQKVSEARKHLTAIEAEGEHLRVVLGDLSTVPALDQQITKAEDDHSIINELAAKIDTAVATHSMLKQMTGVFEQHQAELQAMASLVTPPLLFDVEAAAALICQLSTRQVLYFNSASICEVLRTLDEPPRTADVAPIILAMTEVERSERLVARLSADQSALASLLLAPDSVEVAPIVRLVTHIQQSERVVDGLSADQSALGPLALPPDLSDIESLGTIIQQLNAATRHARFVAAQLEPLTGLAESPVIRETLELRQIVSSLSHAALEFQRGSDFCGRLEDLQTLPLLSDNTQLIGTIENMQNGGIALVEHERQLRNIRSELEEVKDLLLQWAMQTRTCPTCGEELDPSKLASGIDGRWLGHEHG